MTNLIAARARKKRRINKSNRKEKSVRIESNRIKSNQINVVPDACKDHSIPLEDKVVYAAFLGNIGSFVMLFCVLSVMVGRQTEVNSIVLDPSTNFG